MKPRSEHSAIGLPTMEHVVGHQLANLLNAAGMVIRVLEGAPTWDNDMPKKGALDGGTKAAAEASLITLLSRIDSIVTDEHRWSTDLRDTLEKRSLAMVEQNISFLKEQTEAAAMVRKPSFRFRPTLMRIDGGWAAILGDPAQPEESVIGVGANPEAALAAFDELFVGQTPAAMVEWAKKYEQTEQAEVDAGRPEPSDAPAKHRNPKPGNRRGAGQKRSVSNRKNLRAKPPTGEIGGA